MVSDSADFGTIVLEIIKCGANLVSEFFMFFSKIFKPNYLKKNSAVYSLILTLLSHTCTAGRARLVRVDTVAVGIHVLRGQFK